MSTYWKEKTNTIGELKDKLEWIIEQDKRHANCEIRMETSDNEDDSPNFWLNDLILHEKDGELVLYGNE